MRSMGWLGGAVLAVGCACGVAACGSNQDVEVDCKQGAGCVEVPGDATVTVDQPAPEGAMQPGGPIVALETDVRNFKLRPLGACGGAQNCGHLNFTVEGCPAAAAETAGKRAVLDLSECGAGEHRIFVLLHDDHHAVVFHGGRPVGAVVLAVINAEQRTKNGKGNGKKSSNSRNGCECECNCCR